MNKFYPNFFLILMVLVVSMGCSKDVFKSYDERIIGTWELYDVDKRGFGGNSGSLPFQDGTFTFLESGGLTYVNGNGTNYNGSWDISSDWIQGQCSTDINGNYDCSDRNVKTLHITAIDFTAQSVRTEHFDEIDFTSTNRFKGYIYSGAHTYVFFFRRK